MEEFEHTITESPTQFKLVHGKIVDNMQRLRTGFKKNEKGEEVKVDIPRTLVTPARLFGARLDFPHDSDRMLLRNNYFHLAMAAICDPDGSDEVVLGSYDDAQVRKAIDSLSSETELERGSLPISGAFFKEVKKNGGYVIPAEAVRDFYPNFYAHPNIREGAFKFMMEEDERIYDGNLGIVGGTIDDSFRLFLTDTPGLRLVAISDVDNERSGASSRGSLDDDIYDSHLLWEASETQQEYTRSIAQRARFNVHGLASEIVKGYINNLGHDKPVTIKGMTNAIRNAESISDYLKK